MMRYAGRRAMSAGLGAAVWTMAAAFAPSCDSRVTEPSNVAVHASVGGSHPDRLVIDPHSVVLTLNDTITLHALVNGSQQRTDAVTWMSLAPAIVTVNASGLAQGRAFGTARVVAALGKSRDTATVEVPGPVGVRVGSDVASLWYIDATRQLTAAVVDRLGHPVPGLQPTWLSTDPALATVSPAGLVTQVAGMGAVYAIASYADLADTTVLSLRQAPKTILVMPSRVNVALDDTVMVEVMTIDSGGHANTYPNYGSYHAPQMDTIASVSWPSSDGFHVVTGLAPGVAYYYFTATGVSAELIISVAGVQPMARSSTYGLNEAVLPRARPFLPARMPAR